MRRLNSTVRLVMVMVVASSLAVQAQTTQMPRTVALDDFTGNGDAEAAFFIDDPTQFPGRGMIVLIDTGTFEPAADRIITRPGTLVDGRVIADQGSDGRDDLIILRQEAGNPAMLEAYDPVTGRASRRVRLPAGYRAISLDTGHNFACVLMENTATKRPRLINIDVSANTQISKPALPKQFVGRKTQLGAGAGLSPLCSALLTRDSDGKGLIQVRDFATGFKISNIRMPIGLRPIDYTRGPAFMAGSVITLNVRESDNRGRLVAYNMFGGKQWAYTLPANRPPVRVIAFFDDAQVISRIAVLDNGVHATNEGPAVTILDAATGIRVKRIHYGHQHYGVDLSFHPDSSADAGNDPELAVTCIWGERLFRDSVTGKLVGVGG